MHFKDDAQFLNELTTFVKRYKLGAPLYAVLHGAWFGLMASEATGDNWLGVGMLLLLPAFLLAYFLQAGHCQKIQRHAVFLTAAIVLLTWTAFFMEGERDAIECTLVVHIPLILLWCWTLLGHWNRNGGSL